jgi:glycosyltransferase involved in cell wall biosynthesis
MRPSVVYWNNIPSPYMVERFNALSERDAFDFEAWFNDRIEPDRSWEVDEASWRFRYHYLPVTPVLGRKFHWPWLIIQHRPDVLVSLYSEPSFIVGWIIAKLFGVKTVFRVLKTFDSWIRRSRLKNAARRFMFRRADAIETPGNDGKEFAVSSGADPRKVHFATHTVNFDFLSARSAQARLDRQALRRRLALSGITFIYVGRLWRGKGVDYLLDAFEYVSKQSLEEVSLLLIGDGVEQGRLRRRCNDRSLRNVTFTGFKQKADLPSYYAVSDVFVFPTLGDPYGLVVDEAMACSLPIISTSAAGEIRERVEEGVNGYIVPPKDGGGLANRMLTLVRDPLLREEMGRRSQAKVKEHTAENWAKDFERIVESLLSGRDR